MRIDITKTELEAIVDSLSGNPLKCHRKLREELVIRLGLILYPSRAPDKGGWAPIKSSWPSGFIKPDKAPSSRAPKQPKPAPKPLTADDILAELL